MIATSLAARATLAQTAVDTFSAQGVEALKEGRMDEAEKLFQQALRRGGRTAFIHHNLGVIHQHRGAHEKAVLEFRQALRLEPGHGESLLLLGVSLLTLGKNRDAVSSLERAVKLLPNEEPRRQLARAYERLDNWLGAVEQYQALSELKPQEAEYAYQLGRAYTRLSEWSYKRIIALNPDAARLHQALGQQYLTQGKYDLALSEYRRAAQIAPQLPEIHLAMAIIYLEQNNIDEAAKEIALELQLVPENRKALEIKQKIEAAKPR